MELLGIKIVVSEGMAPDEAALLSSKDGVRWTPDGGVERLSEYQRAQIERLVLRANASSE